MDKRAQVNSEDGVLKQVARGMRREATPAEARVWDLLRARRFQGLKFRRQHVLEGKIVDFYCHELRLCVELDGEPHTRAEQWEHDQIRDGELRMKGYAVFRAMNQEVFRDLAGFRLRLLHACSSALSQSGSRSGSHTDPPL